MMAPLRTCGPPSHSADGRLHGPRRRRGPGPRRYASSRVPSRGSTARALAADQVAIDAPDDSIKPLYDSEE